MWRAPRSGANTSFHANVRTNETYTVANGITACPEHLRLTLRDTTRAGDIVTVTVPTGHPEQSLDIYSVDVHHRRTRLSVNGETIQRDNQTGILTIRRLTPEQGTATTVEIIRPPSTNPVTRTASRSATRAAKR